MAALPESFAFMGLTEADKLAIAEDDGLGPIQHALSGLARELGLWIVAGTVPLRVPGEPRVAAACLVLDADGRRAARYDKIHLFDVAIPGKDERYQESAAVRPGPTPVCVDTPAGRLGMAVCYDLRFPELFRGCSTWAPSGSACRPHSRRRPAAPTGKRCCGPGPSDRHLSILFTF